MDLSALRASSGKSSFCFLRSVPVANPRRDYIIEYWPNKGKEGAQIKDMYERIVKQMEKLATGPPNDASNGTTEKPDEPSGQNKATVKQT